MCEHFRLLKSFEAIEVMVGFLRSLLPPITLFLKIENFLRENSNSYLSSWCVKLCFLCSDLTWFFWISSFSFWFMIKNEESVRLVTVSECLRCLCFGGNNGGGVGSSSWRFEFILGLYPGNLSNSSVIGKGNSVIKWFNLSFKVIWNCR